MKPKNDISTLSKFVGSNLTLTLSKIESSISGLSLNDCKSFIRGASVNDKALTEAAELKRAASQIDVTIHAIGIMACLPNILIKNEFVEYVSLGAGNTGRKFDLETNFRVAEFKFINWRGGAESIRQNGIFKDFFELASAETPKRKFLYLLDTKNPEKFFNGGRAIKSVLSKNETTRDRFVKLYGNKYLKVREYYNDNRNVVSIVDVSDWVPQLNV